MKVLVAIGIVLLGVYGQAQYEGGVDGMCTSMQGQTGYTPANYSKNNTSKANCQTKCSNDDKCLGFAWGAEIRDSDGHTKANRCAIFVNSQAAEDVPSYTGWERYASPMWNTDWRLNGVVPNTSQWQCTKRAFVCNSYALRPDAEFRIDYNVADGDTKTYVCAEVVPSISGYDIHGTVTVSCTLGAAGFSGQCTKTAQIVISPKWTPMGQGVCRDISLANAGTGIGQGRSPPNFSRWMEDNESEDDCRSACEDPTFSQLCIGISYYQNLTKRQEDMEVGETRRRCALWMNKQPSSCGNKKGWESHPLHASQWTTANSILGASGEANWDCVKYNRSGQDNELPAHSAGVAGQCTNASGDSPANYSKNGVDFNSCLIECFTVMGSQCVGFSYASGSARCALFMSYTTDKDMLAIKIGWE
eukprot:UN25179